ncbi:phospholipase/Carboxylesterase [Ascosphaera apis ARSEF 7405]|uniref:Phospholipase/Carboxylesterase n=1 Tax=Ascosphaera apis ARSEF 7405 TaxID=392613 RepID=A0A167XGR4_9EURO|nr:phospholipase/Carboxylesterase [Ascosphaera apis ARSEF 7405]
MGPIPKKSDFPSQVTLDIVPPRPVGSAPVRSTNVLILLHGLGDSHVPYISFASAMNLPETTCILIRGPVAMPFDLPGYHWGDDLLLDSNTGLPDVDPGFEKSTKTIAQGVIIDTLVKKLGYRLREILLFGFGQGGSVACSIALEVERRLALARKEAHSSSQESSSAHTGAIPTQVESELGGVISVGAVLPLSASQPNSPLTGKAKTAVLLVGGSGPSSALADTSGVKRTEQTFGAVQVVRWNNRKGDGMPKNREEMLPIMQFFARRLRSRQGVPEGSVEIS